MTALKMGCVKQVFLSFLIALLPSVFTAYTILHSEENDSILDASHSPYYVTSDIYFAALLTIEQGVQIIIIDDSSITIQGSLNCGCSDLTGIIDTSVQGLSDQSSFIHITASSINRNSSTSSGFIIDHSPPGSDYYDDDDDDDNDDEGRSILFCNTLFEGTESAILSLNDQTTSYTAYNCEFRDLYHAIDHQSDSVINYIHDSYFHEVDYIVSEGSMIFDHCAFVGFHAFSGDTAVAQNIAIRDSNISNSNGDTLNNTLEGGICVNVHSVAILYNNVISGCSNGIWVVEGASIRSNIITDCSDAAIVAMDINDELEISYNSFSRNIESHILLQNVMEDAAVTIQYNEFYHGIDDLMTSSIVIENQEIDSIDKYDNETSSDSVQSVIIDIGFNNFYDREHVDWFVTVDEDESDDNGDGTDIMDDVIDLDLNLNDNWWSGLIDDSVFGAIDVEDVCRINLVRVNQEPVNTENGGGIDINHDDDDDEDEGGNVDLVQCSWNMVDCFNFTDYICDDNALSMSSTQVLRASSSTTESDDEYSLRSLVVLTVAATFVIMTLCIVCVAFEYRSEHHLKRKKAMKTEHQQHAAGVEASNPGTVYAAVARVERADADRSSSRLDAVDVTRHQQAGVGPVTEEKDDSLIAYIIHQLHTDQSVSKSDHSAVFSHLFHQYLNDNSRRMPTCDERVDVDTTVEMERTHSDVSDHPECTE